MKKNLFLGISSIFLALFFWKISSFEFANFYLYPLLKNLFTLNQAFFYNLLIVFSLLGGYVLFLVFFSFLSENLPPVFFLMFVPTEITLLILRPALVFWIINLVFIILSALFVHYINTQQLVYVRVNFIEITSKSVHKFSFYCLLILTAYNFALLAKQPENLIPPEILQTIVKPFQTELFSFSGFNQNPVDENSVSLKEPFCNQEGLAQTLCLEKISEFLATSDLSLETSKSKQPSASNLSLLDIISTKINQMILPYQKYLPAFLSLLFFSLLYPFVNLLVLIYTLLAGGLYLFFQYIGFIQIDVRSAAQEFLK